MSTPTKGWQSLRPPNYWGWGVLSHTNWGSMWWTSGKAGKWERSQWFYIGIREGRLNTGHVSACACELDLIDLPDSGLAAKENHLSNVCTSWKIPNIADKTFFFPPGEGSLQTKGCHHNNSETFDAYAWCRCFPQTPNDLAWLTLLICLNLRRVTSRPTSVVTKRHGQDSVRRRRVIVKR